MEGVDYYVIFDVDKMLSNNAKPCIYPQWITEDLGKEDEIWCICQKDKYYYQAKVRKIEGIGEKRKFRITFQGMKASMDQTFNVAQALDSFLLINPQTANFVKAYNEKRLESIQNDAEEEEEEDGDFDGKYDRVGRKFLINFNNMDRSFITEKAFRIRYPPRSCIAEFLGAFSKYRIAFARVLPFTMDDFLAGFKAKIYENNFNNEIFYNEAESQAADQYCTKLKADLFLEIIDPAYHFGVLHLLRYLFHLYSTLSEGGIKTEEDKKLFFLVHEMAQFISEVDKSKKTYYCSKDYVRG